MNQSRQHSIDNPAMLLNMGEEIRRMDEDQLHQQFLAHINKDQNPEINNSNKDISSQK